MEELGFQNRNELILFDQATVSIAIPPYSLLQHFSTQERLEEERVEKKVESKLKSTTKEESPSISLAKLVPFGIHRVGPGGCAMRKCGLCLPLVEPTRSLVGCICVGFYQLLYSGIKHKSTTAKNQDLSTQSK